MYGYESDEDFGTLYSQFGAYDTDEDFGSQYSQFGAYEGMGLLLPGVGTALSTVSGIFTKSKDPGRLASNAEAYKLAIAGNPPYKDQPSALDFLRVMSTSWATDVAKKDAAAKYQQALGIINKQTATAAPKPVATPTTFGGPVVAGLSTGPLLLAGVAVLGITMLSRKRR